MNWITSDLHFNHNREFIYKPRGFNSIEEMNNAIIERFNYCVEPSDHLYILGDIMLGQDLEAGMLLLSELPGNIHLVRGNHDTDRRWEAYSQLHNVVEQAAAIYLKYGKYHFYLSHFPTLTGNLEKESLSQMTLNLFGHTHSKDLFYMDMPYMYNVAVDAHNCYPVDLDAIIEQMKEKIDECYDFL
jgi:calcineurin-like phosphoesterase family protein